MRKRKVSRGSGSPFFGPTSPATIIILAAIIGGGVYTIFHRSERTDPPRALSRSVEMLDFDPRAIESLLDVAAQEPALSPWVNLTKARAAEKRGDTSSATELYRSIPETSPASVDAALALLRLALVRPTPQPDRESSKNDSLKRINELEQQFVRVRRTDLVGELSLLQATQLADAAPAEALATLLKVRRSASDPEIIKRAIEQSQQLLNSKPQSSASGADSAAPLSNLRTSMPPGLALDLVRALIRERDGVSALSEIQSLTSRLPNQSRDFFDARLLEEQVLRVLKRNEEADHLLSLLSADGPAGIADVALLKLAKNSWNSDDHDAALSFLASLRERFPTSDQNAEGNYVEARIYEETNQPADAKDTYEKLANTTSDAELQIKSLHRIAWLYIRSQNFGSAIEFLRKIKIASASAIKKGLAAKEAQGLDFFLDEYLHSIYWEAICLTQLDDRERAAVATGETSSDSLLSELARKYPTTYYGVLARKNLRFSDEKLEPWGIPTADGCYTSLTAEQQHLFELLQSGGLSAFAQHEIDWAFPAHSGLDIKADLSRANYYQQYSTAQLAVRTADSVLRSRNIQSVDQPLPDDLERCALSSTALAYSEPFSEQFLGAAKEAQIKKELLYAIARTESFFDPNAVSRSGAIGLAQLLPATAKYEGLNEGANLFDIRTNLNLAAKHLSRLLAQFTPTPEYAIAAYNAGAPAVNRWRTRYEEADVQQWVELIGYPETKDYVKKVLLAQAIYQELARLNPSSRK